ncbi:MAG: chorismate synthase [Thermogutta sp.]
MLRYWTAGESHGKGILALVDGFPAGIKMDIDVINRELARRQGGFGRGGRQRIEQDQAEILSGLWRGVTIGSPIAIWVANRDHKIDKMDDLPCPRPGHGDLAGAIKYFSSIRGILERASARETVGRVAAGALARLLLKAIDIEILGYVVEIGPLRCPPHEGSLDRLRQIRDASELYTLCPECEDQAKDYIRKCQKEGDTVGGVVEVRVENVPFGLGTHAQWDRKLDGRLAQAVMAVQAIKGVEIGLGFEAARRPGSKVHDPIRFDQSQQNSRTFGLSRSSNHAGGLEAGMSNAQPIIVRAAMKPISTLARPLESINLKTKQPEMASYERSDVCAVSAASVIVENVVAFEIAAAIVEKFGGDHVDEIRHRIELFERMSREKLGL